MRKNHKTVVGLLGLLLVGMALGGCGGQDAPESATSAAPAPAAPAQEPGAESNDALPGGGAGAVAQQSKAAVARKIIYTATVALIVEKLSPAQQKLMELVRKHRGYVAETNVSGSSGAPRNGSWKIRVPADGYHSFVDAVSKIGEVQTLTTGSSDVSEEYYDIEARLRNKRLEEKRLLEHLNRSTSKLTEILQVEKEISRVREEIERMQGRLRVLANLTSLTTITVTIQEVKDYTPPAPPTFSTEIMRSFQASFGGLINFGKGLVLLTVALLPWLVVFAVIAFPVSRILRRRNTHGEGKTPKSSD